jgi:hypothetical protein
MFSRVLSARLAIPVAGIAVALVLTQPAFASCNPQMSTTDVNRSCNIRHAWMPFPNACSSSPVASHFAGYVALGKFVHANAAEMTTGSTYTPYVASISGTDAWVGLYDSSTVCPPGSAYSGHPFFQVGQFTGTNTGGHAYAFTEYFSCLHGQSGPVTYPSVNLGTAGHQYELLPQTASFTFNLDVDYVVLLPSYTDPNVYYDSPEYADETHDPGDQNLGGTSDPVHIYNERVGKIGGTLQVPSGGTFLGGNASNGPSAYWQQINGIDATQWYTADLACPS